MLPIAGDTSGTGCRSRLGKLVLLTVAILAIVAFIALQLENDDSIDSDEPSMATQDRTGSPAESEISSGFVPAPWTATLPENVVSATVDTILDGDTFDLVADGQAMRTRLYRSNTPEDFDPVECGGVEATAFVRSALAQSDTPGQVWVEDVDQLDRYGRALAYLWFTIDGQPYLLNHILINSGWAENIGYGDAFDPYRTELAAAADFARTNALGVWGACGAFGLPATDVAARSSQSIVIQPTSAGAGSAEDACHPSYVPCVPISSIDLDCKDVGFRVEVVGIDEYRLDNDDPDLLGCELFPPKP